MKIDTIAIQQPTYDEFGHVVANDRSGTAADMQYAYAKDSTDYCGSLILRNAHPSQYLFEGGFASFDADTLSGWHYYVQDYMGNNRMVVNKDGTVEQVTHYYPYGGVIGDISTNESLQAYKFEGKVLAAIEKIDNLRREDEPLGEGQDRTFGLDWYDIQARQYDAIGGTWYAIDPLAEKTPEISPYAMCAGNPVNYGDYDGMDWYLNDSTGYYTWFNDEGIDNPCHEGYTYVGKEGAACGELEALIDDILVKNCHKNDGFYSDGLTFRILDDKSLSEKQIATGLFSSFHFGIDAEVTMLTEQTSSTQVLMKDPLVREHIELAKKYGYSNRPWNLLSMLNIVDNASWTKQFIGSYDVRVFNMDNGTIANILYDKKDCHSLYYHCNELFLAPNHSRRERKHQGTTYQFYIWKTN